MCRRSERAIRPAIFSASGDGITISPILSWSSDQLSYSRRIGEGKNSSLATSAMTAQLTGRDWSRWQAAQQLRDAQRAAIDVADAQDCRGCRRLNRRRLDIQLRQHGAEGIKSQNRQKD